MEKKDDKVIVENLKKTFCRLRPSSINGVGVFSVVNIPKGVNPFQGIANQEWHEFDISKLKGLDKEILEMIDSFFVVEKNGKVLIPEFGLNGMDISFFLNHSTNPNVKTIDDGLNFLTLRDIKKGEELTVSYGTYDYKYK
jgi:SET domain-containing protein